MRDTDRLHRLIEWYKWILRFDPVRYFGLSLMTFGPWFFIYRFLFIGTSYWELSLGTFGFFALGVFVWYIGWDPYK